VFSLAWPPLVFGAAFLLLWELAVRVFDFQPYFLPAPSAIWDAFRTNTSLIWEATKVSGLNALLGLVVGTAIGVAMAFLLARWRLVDDLLSPHAVPFLFTALKIAAPASVITAFVSEYFGGLQNGLGSRIVSNIALSNNAEAWAYVLGACLLGLAFFLAALALEQVATPGGVGARERDRA
jgi:ABC-type nitrate/sulfonate/bicarbonate transport system permease component